MFANKTNFITNMNMLLYTFQIIQQERSLLLNKKFYLKLICLLNMTYWDQPEKFSCSNYPCLIRLLWKRHIYFMLHVFFLIKNLSASTYTLNFNKIIHSLKFLFNKYWGINEKKQTQIFNFKKIFNVFFHEIKHFCINVVWEMLNPVPKIVIKSLSKSLPQPFSVSSIPSFSSFLLS